MIPKASLRCSKWQAPLWQAPIKTSKAATTKQTVKQTSKTTRDMGRKQLITPAASAQVNQTAQPQDKNNSNQGGTDIGGILQALQSNPQMLNGILNSLGATGNQGSGNPLQGGNQANNLGALAGLGNLGNLAPGGTQNPLSALAGLGDIGAIAKILKALNSNVCDDRAALLNALKPHLCEKRRQRVDKAVKMLRLVSLLPLLREQGIFEFIMNTQTPKG